MGYHDECIDNGRPRVVGAFANIARRGQKHAVPEGIDERVETAPVESAREEILIDGRVLVIVVRLVIVRARKPAGPVEPLQDRVQPRWKKEAGKC